MARARKRPLTAEEERFYAGFTPMRVNPKFSLHPGSKALVVGDHPHRGEKITVLQENVIMGGFRFDFLVKSDDWGGEFTASRANLHLLPE